MTDLASPPSGEQGAVRFNARAFVLVLGLVVAVSAYVGESLGSWVIGVVPWVAACGALATNLLLFRLLGGRLSVTAWAFLWPSIGLGGTGLLWHLLRPSAFPPGSGPGLVLSPIVLGAINAWYVRRQAAQAS